jgi:hypothetical protein
MRFSNFYYGINLIGSYDLTLKDLCFYSCNIASLVGDSESHIKSITGSIYDVGSPYCKICGSLIYGTDATRVSANLYLYSVSTTTGGLMLDGDDYIFTGDIDITLKSSGYGVDLGVRQAFFKKLTVDAGYALRADLTKTRVAGFVLIDHLDINYSSPYLLSNGMPAGIIRIGAVEYSGTLSLYTTSSPYTEMARVAIDCINGDATKFLGCSRVLTWGDHVSMGQTAGWAYGGSGKSLVLSPLSTTGYGRYMFFIPAPAAGTYKLSMQVRKTSSGANCELKYNVWGCGITPVADESVTLTDSWAEHTTASGFTTTRAGMLMVELYAKDGSTTGDIGIDDIKLEAVA